MILYSDALDIILSYLVSWTDALAFRAVAVEWDMVFRAWFRDNDITVLFPASGMLKMDCDSCETNLVGSTSLRMLSLPWYPYNPPTFVHCDRAVCTRNVVRSILRMARRLGYRLLVKPAMPHSCTVDGERILCRPYVCRQTNKFSVPELLFFVNQGTTIGSKWWTYDSPRISPYARPLHFLSI